MPRDVCRSFRPRSSPVSSACTTRAWAGERIIRFGEKGKELSIVVSGKTEVSWITPEGKRERLKVLEGEGFFGEHLEFALALSDKRGQVAGTNDIRILKNKDAFNNMGEFPDISWPGIFLQDFHGLGSNEGHGLFHLFTIFF